MLMHRGNLSDLLAGEFTCTAKYHHPLELIISLAGSQALCALCEVNSGDRGWFLVCEEAVNVFFFPHGLCLHFCQSTPTF